MRHAIRVLWGATALVLSGSSAATPKAVDYSHDVRPILAKKCFACHGPDASNRKAQLRLDTSDGPREAKDELLARIKTHDDDDRMPPADFSDGKRLTLTEVEVIERWMAQGAPFQDHWAFTAPTRHPVSTPANTRWPRNDIDRFVLGKLEKEGLAPSPEADGAALLRRASLDLIGLLPTLEEHEALRRDRRPGAYERAVDRLLASPHYGERMALMWLDAARYADTHGLHVDSAREMWPWRDWVIDAFNRNLPFDQFTVEQLAGDLLPEPTRDQRVATGFHRNHLISGQNSEIPEKVHVGYVVDRVNTTGAVWLGLTLSCAQCHDHKFDPISQLDYYRLFAFFNNIDEKAIDGRDGNAAPTLPLSANGKLTTMVMAERAQQRPSHLLIRGEYDQKGAPVEPGTPSVLPAMAPELPRNRLGLARWLVDARNPLPARVFVNRLWQMLFGTGLVATSEDFGQQGEVPSHPELLDHLATEFVRGGWDVKAMLRLMVTSATYWQRSAAPAAAYARDPDNRLLARGPRFRLDAELIRDAALRASGLLSTRIGGPSVKPYQPAGVWAAVASAAKTGMYTAQVYEQDHGESLYRRGLYTFWKRLAPPPALAAFDAPTRESCTTRRPRTNTPLQALVLMNDPTFIEAARALAAKVMHARRETDGRIALAFRLVTGREPAPDELRTLSDTFRRQHTLYRRDEASARALLGVGETPVDAALDPRALAALTTVTSVILNLDEAITKG